MTWRGANTIQDRIFACLVYAFPLIEVFGFGQALFVQAPFLQYIYLPLLPFIFVYGLLNQLLFGYGSLLIFFGLYIGIVRNERFRHFLRFNTMQALLLAIFAYICALVLRLLGFLQPAGAPSLLAPAAGGSTSLFTDVLSIAIFLVVWVGSVFSIVQAARGLYGELPVISDASYTQTR
jgi:hypothetical protein